MVSLEKPQAHVDQRVVGWSAGRHVDLPCGWQISPWPARKVIDLHAFLRRLLKVAFKASKASLGMTSTELRFFSQAYSFLSSESKCYLRVVIFRRVPSARKKRNWGKLFHLQLELVCLQLSFFAYSPLRPLLDALSHCKHKSSNCKQKS